MKTFSRVTLFAGLMVVFAAVPAWAQRRGGPVKRPQKQIVFLVDNDGKSVEPIAYIDRGKLESTVGGGDEEQILKGFSQNYYRTGTNYRMVFGGSDAGTVTVRSSNVAADCVRNGATVTTKSAKGPLKGYVMALATNAPVTGSFFRRKPTATEKAAADAVAKAEFVKQGLNPKVLRFINLTAIDVDHNGTPELVGSYWTEVNKTTRALYFFIAAKTPKGKYTAGYGAYQTIDKASVMSGEISAVDEGIYHETLIDYMDIDGDGVAEIFTGTKSFEGAGFNVYKLNGGKWERIFEGSNYHCAY